MDLTSLGSSTLPPLDSPPPPSVVAEPPPPPSPQPQPVPLPPKVRLHFLPTGSAPLLKKSKFAMSGTQPFASVVMFLRRQLELDAAAVVDTASATTSSTTTTTTKAQAQTPLFLYINSAFSPNPTDDLATLYQCFSIRGELCINYCLQEAWG